ncbi:aldo/keto reductase [Paenibacillus sp. J2TS4]|uniref:aldo/keto reductase n=1 Tax=Paenibacillus sp. J2TS4 TaxID=2807194 RepID=UPI001B0C7107|nr:aldo/keto reductase [Paenibacillus sp. J2TS4]GIP32507.1 aldo/keto reductase [Paenibacillus sp. J2TS4]
MINKRRLGRTGLQVAELGFGAWAIGGTSYGEVKEQDAVSTVEAYLESGGNLIDTARGYGLSEKWIGKALEGRNREEVVLITKSGNSETAERIPRMWQDLETSLTELKTGYVDVLMMHLPSEDPAVMELAIGEMKKMKKQGLIRHIGASIKGPAVTDETVAMCRQYIAQGEVDVFETVYSVLRQKLDYDGIFETCHQAGVGLVIRTVLESGFLTGKYAVGHRFASTDHRNRWSEKALDTILQSVSDLREWIPEGTPDLSAFSIQFVLANPHLSTVIVGARNPGQLFDNLRAASLPPLPKPLLARLKQFGYHKTELYNL